MRLCSCDDFALQFQAGNVTGFPLNFGGLSKEHSEEMWDLLWTDTGLAALKCPELYMYICMCMYHVHCSMYAFTIIPLYLTK